VHRRPRHPRGAADYLDQELLLAGAELIWQAGGHGDEKGHGICHGTSRNGFALLKAFARTGDELWLERARRFATHALGQAERLATANHTRRHSLFTGDLGTALFAAACLDLDPRYPIVDTI
jgi:Lanthionine synthetase C-like protein